MAGMPTIKRNALIPVWRVDVCARVCACVCAVVLVPFYKRMLGNMSKSAPASMTVGACLPASCPGQTRSEPSRCSPEA